MHESVDPNSPTGVPPVGSSVTQEHYSYSGHRDSPPPPLPTQSLLQLENRDLLTDHSDFLCHSLPSRRMRHPTLHHLPRNQLCSSRGKRIYCGKDSRSFIPQSSYLGRMQSGRPGNHCCQKRTTPG